MAVTGAVVGSVALLFIAPSVAGAVTITQNSANQTTSITGLNGDSTCEEMPMVGRVVKRTFDRDALSLREFVIEKPDGARELINVDTTGLAGVELGNVDNGLQRLTKVGRIVHGRVALCGVSGAVGVLDDIR